MADYQISDVGTSYSPRTETIGRIISWKIIAIRVFAVVTKASGLPPDIVLEVCSPTKRKCVIKGTRNSSVHYTQPNQLFYSKPFALGAFAKTRFFCV